MPVSNIPAAGKSSATSYGSGGGKAVAIPSGQLFAGRQAGGGTRDQVTGTSVYGSGYPGITGRGVAGRGFPFYFWPIVWGGGSGIGTAAYLHDENEVRGAFFPFSSVSLPLLVAFMIGLGLMRCVSVLAFSMDGRRTHPVREVS